MDSVQPEKILREIPKFHDTAETVSREIHDGVLKGGDEVREVVDVLHGKWLGHPLHPVLTDITIGAWMLAALFDFLDVTDRSRTLSRAADKLIGLGILSSIPTALAGVADFTTIPRRAMSTGAMHGILNVTGLLFYTLSFVNRRAKRRGMGRFLSGLGLGILTGSAWLGGELVYKYGVSVNKQQAARKPQEWTSVIIDQDLGENQPKRVDVEGEPVLLYRDQGTVYAIQAVCTHDGGPLEQGKFYDLCVECPWHQSVFDLRTGKVVHGPSTYAESSYDTRIMDGKIEIRLREA